MTATSDSGIFSALTDSLVDPQAAIAKGHSLTRQSRAAKQLTAANDRLLAAIAAQDKHRHAGAQDDREVLRAYAAFHAIATKALGLKEPA